MCPLWCSLCHPRLLRLVAWKGVWECDSARPGWHWCPLVPQGGEMLLSCWQWGAEGGSELCWDIGLSISGCSAETDPFCFLF